MITVGDAKRKTLVGKKNLLAIRLALLNTSN